MNNKGGRIRKEAVVTYFKIFSQYSYKGTEEKHKKSQEGGRQAAKFETAIPPVFRSEELPFQPPCQVPYKEKLGSGYRHSCVCRPFQLLN